MSIVTAELGRSKPKHRRAGRLVAALLTAGLAVTGVVQIGPATAADRPWMNTSLSPDQRADRLAAAMTLDQKVRLFNPNGDVTVPELGIPPRHEIDATLGVHSGTQKTTSMPSSLALAASGDQQLARDWGRQTAQETFLLGYNGDAAPTLDVGRSAYWGRLWETLGEDPVLSGTLGKAEINGIQDNPGSYALVKHFGVYTQETGRADADNVIDERTMRELYLRNWQIATADAKPGAVMCAFPKINGDYACENSHLLNDILKNEWDYQGFVSTDYGAGHTWDQFNRGTDVTGSPFIGDELKSHVQDGSIAPARFEDMVHRILRTMFAEGLFDRRAPGTTGNSIDPPQPLPSAVLDAGEKVAERAATEGSVLLKNTGNALPLAGQTKSIAVIGSGADEYITGTGSPQVPQPARLTTILDGVKARAGAQTSVSYTPGTDDARLGDVLPGPAPVPSSVLKPATGSGSGLTAEYFANPTRAGQPLATRLDDQVNLRTGLPALIENFDTHTRTEPGQVPFPLLVQPGSIRWTGTLNPVVSGRYTLALTHFGSASLTVNGQRVIADAGTSLGTHTASVDMIAGRSYAIRIDYAADAPNQCCAANQKEGPTVRLGWIPPTDTASPQIRAAVAAAKKSQVAVVVVRDEVGEATDRYSLTLPQDQDRLVRAVAAVNKHTIVISATAGPVLMPWLNKVDGVIQSWYPGEAGGKALAALLYGDANFSGKLPVTFPRSEQQVEQVTPGANATSDFGVNAPTLTYPEGVFVGYRGYQKQNLKPQFAFGAGLDYTKLFYTSLRVLRQGDQASVRVVVANTGRRTGTAHLQAYVGELPTKTATPKRQLAGFGRITLKPGQVKLLTIPIDTRALQYWDASKSAWATPAGAVRVYVGPNSSDLREAGFLRS